MGLPPPSVRPYLKSYCCSNPTACARLTLACRAHLDSRLSDFVDAVSRGDVVTMRTQADNAFKVLDDLSSLEAPEPLKDVAAGYVDGANSLKDALNSYIQLYTEIDGATTTDPFDWSTYDSRLQAIQDAYNAGIDKLKAADEAAAGKD